MSRLVTLKGMNGSGGRARRLESIPGAELTRACVLVLFAGCSAPSIGDPDGAVTMMEPDATLLDAGLGSGDAGLDAGVDAGGSSVDAGVPDGGAQFVAYGRRKTPNEKVRVTSPDGLSWSATPVEVRQPDGGYRVSDPFFVPWALGGGATVAVSDSYASQLFYRSDDGVHFDPVSGPRGHPITHLIFTTLRDDPCP